jgi:effector-binding domain-containing protein
VDEAFPELFDGWPVRHSGGRPPFIRYLVIDMAAELEIELAVPVGAPAGGTGRIRAGVLPGGRYAVLRHTGPYDGLITSNAALQRWARDHGVELDTWDTARGSAWRSRAEHYLTDPSREPDPAKWEVDVAYLTRGA